MPRRPNESAVSVWGRVFDPAAERSLGSFQEQVMTSNSKLSGLGIGLGAALGAVFGIVAGHLGIWLAIGVVIGVLIGASFRRKQTICPECAQIHRIHEMRNPRQQASSSKLAARS